MKIVRFVQALFAFALSVLIAGCGGGGSGNFGNNPPPPTPPPTQPQLSITTTSLPLGLVGTHYSAQFTTTNGAPPFTWSVPDLSVPPGLKFNAGGLLDGTPTISFCGASLTVTVKDSSSPVQSASASFQYDAAGGDVSLGGGQVGDYFHGAIMFECATEPVSWSLVSGSLPDGLQMQPFSAGSSQLNFPGIPTQAGTFNLTVQAKDASNRVIQVSAPLIILPPPLKITDSSVMQLGVVNQAFDHTLTTTGGTPPYNFTVDPGSFPTGLQLNASTGEISGTPKTAGYYQFSIQATDLTTPTQFRAQKSYTMLVTPAALSGHNDSIATATPIVPGAYTASLSPYTDSAGNAAPDQDYYSLTGNGGDTFSIIASGSYDNPNSPGTLNTPTDPAIEILDSSGTKMTTCNDPIADYPPAGAPITKGTATYTDSCVDHLGGSSIVFLQSALTVKLPPGSNQVFYIHVFDFQGRARPDFIYTLAVSKK